MLINVVRTNLNKTNQELIDWLNQDVQLRVDSNLYTIAQVKIVLNNTDALRLVCGTIKAATDLDPLVWAFSQKIFSTGISFADAETQAMIDGLAAAGSWPDVIRDAVKSIGILNGKRWQQLGLNKLPTSEEINIERANIVKLNDVTNVMNLMSELMQHVGTFVGQTNNEILAPAINNWQSLDEVKGLIDSTKLDDIIQYANNIKQAII